MAPPTNPVPPATAIVRRIGVVGGHGKDSLDGHGPVSEDAFQFAPHDQAMRDVTQGAERHR